jgi:membrane fusion protein (multidrug efflux system)
MDAVRALSRDDSVAEGAQVLPLDLLTLERSRVDAKTAWKTAAEIAKDDPVRAFEPSGKAAPGLSRTDPNMSAPVKKRRSRARLLLPIGALMALTAAGWYAHQWWTNGRFMVSTDDAYVQADVATLGSKVAGYVGKVNVRDGDAVKAGDVLVTIDDTDYRLALDTARAKRETQAATIARIERQIGAYEAQIESAEAGVASAQAEATRAAAAALRAQALAQQSFQSKAALDQAVADRDRSAAGVANAKAALTTAHANLEVVRAEKAEAEQVARELDTAVAKAESDLSFTVIRAPTDGLVGNRAAQPGQYVAPGARLLALVPMSSVYVAANFKETQLGSIRPGQHVALEVDSISGRTFEGRVASIAPASGSTFSLLPPENATGNFTKITQRVPVRVEVPVAVAAQGMLRPGLSVVVSVDTRT